MFVGTGAACPSCERIIDGPAEAALLEEKPGIEERLEADACGVGECKHDTCALEREAASVIRRLRGVENGAKARLAAHEMLDASLKTPCVRAMIQLLRAIISEGK